MIVLAIDQSTSKCGYAVYDTDKGKFVTTGSHEVAKFSDIDARISYVKKFIIKLISYYKPALIISEDVQFQKNQRTYKVLSELLGVICNSYFEAHLNYKIVSPPTWKSYCGCGSGNRAQQKKDTIKMVKEKFGITADEDEADAIGLCCYGAKLFE